MKKYKLVFLFLFMLVCTIKTPALTITHPEAQDITVHEDAIFFTGKIERREKVYINDKQMIPSRARAFSYSVPLKPGENIFAVQKKDWLGNIETIKYTITRTSKSESQYKNEFIETPKAYYKTTKDNVVLRSTPIDAGMNRLGYLPKDTELVIDGTQNEFSRIYLAKDKYGWAMTKDLKKLPLEKETIIDEETGEETEQEVFKYHPKSIISNEQTKKGDEKGITVKLSANTPYSAIIDHNKLVLQIYNLDTLNETFTKEFSLGKFPRYSVKMQDNTLEVVFKKCPINKSTYSNKDVKIVIDAGHGGSEIGAVGCLGHREKTINLDVALKLKKLLEFHNFDVYMVRENDKFVSLNDRVEFAKEKDALIFISIHMNSVPISSNPNLNEGSIVFYYNPTCQQFAQAVVKTLSQELETKNGGAAQASFAVIRPTEYIGILAELAYLVNPNDVSIYKTKRFAHTSAVAIYKGLVNYIHSSL
ncbi:MAG: N-acetylmuramoyl-L-alanine amidase [Candidatus Gastranaerophilales bacterium]|nr:N-acetylmuramoyl-L-alanine amidase [Candidatus Gastranaerophilales bacterium]